MNQYEPFMGIEIHVELSTKSKMFCRCSTDYFGKAPNTHTCPICLGLPGSLPYINKEAINSCMKIGLALNCSVAEISRFERKNYFYPDLPKGYQISQYRWPLCTNGFLEVINKDGEKKKIRINRVHQEEDTGKLTHTSGQTLIDFNRSGVPLVEIVTEPDFSDSSEVRDYTKKIQQLVRYLGVSNADMERGDLRLEANISVRPEHFDDAQCKLVKGLPPYRIELKNINSFKFMVDAIEYEIKRQIEALEKGDKLTQETRGWDEVKKETYLQRSKEEAHDYRYFPEPDLPKLQVKSDELIIKAELPELPDQKNQRFIKEYGLTLPNSLILTEEGELANIFEALVKGKGSEGVTPQQIANYIVNKKPSKEEIISGQIISQITSKQVGIIQDKTELEKLAEEAIKENPSLVDLYKKGKITVIQALVGAVMRKTSGKADPLKTRVILEEKLK